MNNFDILVIDDDSVDIIALRRAFNKHTTMRKAVLHIAKNGKEAFDMLLAEVPLRPTLAILDLNMPGMGGLQFLDKVRSCTQLSKLRILVLTTSADSSDIQAAIDKCIVGYITKAKAGNYTELTELIYTYCKLTET